MSQKITPKPDSQVGGTHYSDLKIEPIQFIEANGLDYCEGNAIKYLSRWKSKNGLEDLRKAAWYVERLIQVEEARVDAERREELNEAIAVNFGPGAPGSGDSCSMPLKNDCEDCTCADEVDNDINDLHFFGWHNMTDARRKAVREAACLNGLDIVAQLRFEAEDSTEDKLNWSV